MIYLNQINKIYILLSLKGWCSIWIIFHVIIWSPYCHPGLVLEPPLIVSGTSPGKYQSMSVCVLAPQPVWVSPQLVFTGAAVGSVSPQLGRPGFAIIIPTFSVSWRDWILSSWYRHFRLQSQPPDSLQYSPRIPLQCPQSVCRHGKPPNVL